MLSNSFISTIIIKSTVPPGTTDRLHKKYKGVDVIFNPEFLTEMNFLEDFKNQNRIILGGIRKGTNKLRQIYSKVFPQATIVKTGSRTAEMVIQKVKDPGNCNEKLTDQKNNNAVDNLDLMIGKYNSTKREKGEDT